METRERIGRVTLDYSYYPGEDLYSDGQIEDELLDIVMSHEENEFETIIEEKNEWAILYHLSSIRQNIINWFPFDKNQKVLEIGSGCGAITGAIAKRAGSVDCVELSRKRSLINANRNKKNHNITITVGNFEEIEPFLGKDYDVITLIGVWEYSALYLSSKTPFTDFLQLLKKHLKENGKIIIAIENKFGLKYWAGCREDHTGLFFEGLEGYTNSNGAVTFGKNQLQDIFQKTEYHAKFYYPYPDYKLPLYIYSDEHLPKEDDLQLNQMNLDTDRLDMFDEKKVYNSLLQEKMFPFFANSFLIILEKKDTSDMPEMIYSEYLNERKEEFNIYKALVKKGESKQTRLAALNDAANHHMQHIDDLYKKIKSKNICGNMQFVPCKSSGNVVEYVTNQEISVYDYIALLEKQNKSGEVQNTLKELIKQLIDLKQSTFECSENFIKIFGNTAIENIPAIDGIYFNVMLKNLFMENGKWSITEYEWDFDFPIPVNYLIYRILKWQLPPYMAEKYSLVFKFSQEEVMAYDHMELNFQKYLMGNRRKLSESSIVKPAYNIKKILEKKSFVKVYFDYGEGYSEENMKPYFYEAADAVHLDILVNDMVKGVRIDPMENSGMVFIDDISCLTKQGDYRPKIENNGICLDNNFYAFFSKDPWFLIPELQVDTIRIKMTMKVEMISGEFMSRLAEKGKIETQNGEKKPECNRINLKKLLSLRK